MKSKKLTANQITLLRKMLSDSYKLKFGAVQGNISCLMELSFAIGYDDNYSIVQNNLSKLI